MRFSLSPEDTHIFSNHASHTSSSYTSFSNHPPLPSELCWGNSEPSLDGTDRISFVSLVASIISSNAVNRW